MWIETSRCTCLKKTEKAGVYPLNQTFLQVVQIRHRLGCIGDIGTVRGPSEAQRSNIRHHSNVQIQQLIMQYLLRKCNNWANNGNWTIREHINWFLQSRFLAFVVFFFLFLIRHLLIVMYPKIQTCCSVIQQLLYRKWTFSRGVIPLLGSLPIDLNTATLPT